MKNKIKMLKIKDWLKNNKPQFKIMYDPADFMPCAIRLRDNKVFKLGSSISDSFFSLTIDSLNIDRIHIDLKVKNLIKGEEYFENMEMNWCPDRLSSNINFL